MADSGVVLLMTTGLILGASSDDELLGYAAHEIGHEYFVHYSVMTQHLLKTVTGKGNEPVLRRKLAELFCLVRTPVRCLRSPHAFIAWL